MKALADRGFAQGVLPPHERPDVAALRALGFSGDDAQVLRGAERAAPQLLAACSSAAAMWVANAATVSPSADTADRHVHFTPANLISHFHRSLEAPTTTRVLRAIFADDRHFAVHDPLPSAPQFGDEGAANHTRFAAAADDRGLRRRRACPATLSRPTDARGKRSGRSPPRAGARAHALCAATSGCDRHRRVSQRRDRGRQRQRSVLSRARVRRTGDGNARIARLRGRALHADRRHRARGQPRTRGRHLSFQ